MDERQMTFEGVLLRVVDYRERDCIVTFLGRGIGKGSAYAHAARASRKRFPGGLELFRWYRLAIKRSERTAGALPQLSLADPLTSLHGMSSSLERIAIASCGLELVRELVHEGNPQDEILDALWTFLSTLHDDIGGEDVAVQLLALRWLELHILDIQGVAPQLDRCVRTGSALADCDEVVLSVLAGGVLDRAVAEETDQAVPVSAALLAGIMRLQGESLEAIVAGAAERADQPGNAERLAAFVGQSGRLTRLLVDQLVEKRLKSYDFLARITR